MSSPAPSKLPPSCAPALTGFSPNPGKRLNLAPDKMIAIGEKWPQPILRDGRASLLVESDDGNTDWRVAGRDLVKRESN